MKAYIVKGILRRLGLPSALLAIALHASGGPLDTWTIRSSGTALNLRAITCGNGRFLAVGDFGTATTSTNGTNWTSAQLGTANHLYGTAFGDELFLVVGQGGIILSSSNLVDWVTQSSGTTNDLKAVARAGAAFVAAGNAGTLLTSPEGVAWTACSPGTTKPLLAFASGNGLISAVGGGNSSPGAATMSHDGITWSNQGLGVILYGVAFGSGVFVAMDARGVAYTSTDAANWRERWPPIANGDYLFGITYAQDTFVAVGGPYSSGSQRIATSPDGTNWVLRPVSTQLSPVLRAVAYGNGYFIAVGEKGLILQSGPIARLRGASAVSADGFGLSLTGESGRSYRIQAATNPAGTNWVDVISFTNPTETIQFLDTAATNLPRRFYRAVSP